MHRYYRPRASEEFQLPREYKIGDFVIVASEYGGQDLGIVVELVTCDYALSLGVKIADILYEAGANDRMRLVNRYHDETAVLQVRIYL